MSARAVRLPALLRRSLTARTWIGLGAAVVIAAVFLEITSEVIKGHTNAMDQSVSLWIHGFDSPLLGHVMRAFTFLGIYPVLLPASALVAMWARRRNAAALALVLVAVVASAVVLNAGLKLVFHRTRPGLFFEIMVPATFSFPSGHAMVSAAAYGTCAIVIARLRPRLRTPLYTVTPLLVFFIGISRVYLGVHWPTDVAAGFAAGALLVLAGNFAIGRVTMVSRHPGEPPEAVTEGTLHPA